MKIFRFNTVKKLFTGYTSNKAQEIDFQRKTIILIASIAFPTGAIFSTINFLNHHTWLAIVELFAIALLYPCFRMISDKSSLTFAKNLLMFSATMVFIAIFIDGGVGSTGMLWTLILPFIALLVMGLPTAWYWIMAYFTASSASVIAHFMEKYTLPYNNEALLYYPIIFILFSLVAAVFEMQFERLKIRYEKNISKLQHLQSHLQHNITQRTHALQKVNDKLQDEIEQHKETSQALKDSETRFYQAQKMDAVGTLVGGIAHDFNNMLAGINANLFMVKRKINADPEVHSKLENVESLVMSASDMIRQLLTFARKDHVEFKYFDLVPFMNEAYKLAEVAVSEQIKIRYESDNSQEIRVQANGTQLQQVLMNLVNNARDALKNSDKPTIHIKLQTYQANNTFKAQHPELYANDYAILTVADNGQGIPPKTLVKIFEPFFTTKEIGKGTGLGLSMCYGAIQSHNGTIEVQSKPGKGTAFKVYIPICSDDFSKQMDLTIHNAVLGNGETILLADDDERLRKAQKEVLESLGYSIIEASHGREAVTLFAEHNESVDLVIIDLTMPVMGGVPAARKIRSIRENARIIFVTGYDKDSSINGEYMPSSDEFVLEKPYTMDELSSVIRKQLLTQQ